MDGFLDYKRFRWALITGLMLLACSGIYMFNSPLGGRNGGTIVGYSFGALATIGILYLMWFGVRKRSYQSRTTPLKGWLSAHVWLGLGLIVLVPLHAGFSFGCNIHTLAFAILCLVVVTGIWGAVAYATMAPRIRSHRGSPQSHQLLEQIHALQTEMASLASTKGALYRELSIQLTPALDLKLSALLFKNVPPLPDPSATAKLIAGLPLESQASALNLAALARRRHDLVTQLVRETRILTTLRFWLILHLPLSFALLAAVAAHIFVVFWYW